MKKLVCSPRMTSFFLRVAMSHARENRKPAYACSHAVSGFSIFSYTANAATAFRDLAAWLIAERKMQGNLACSHARSWL